METLADNREDLFSSMDNLQTFTSALATIDTQVSQFNDNMAAVMDLLASERQDLADAITLLSQALKDVAAFVRTNSDLVTVNVDRLADVTLALVQQRSALAEVLDVAPAALGNLARAYNPDYGTLDTRDNGVGAANAEVVVCGALFQAGRLTLGPDLDPLVAGLQLPTHTDEICARILSGDANNDGSLDDLNGNGVPDYEELRQALLGAGAPPPPPGGTLVGFPSIGAGGQG
ncbi:MAG: hypothetical protein M3Q22_06675 [Actinomycetota bacterium]|nr:hypothetical protein [Actinomycetota bacterium]